MNLFRPVGTIALALLSTVRSVFGLKIWVYLGGTTTLRAAVLLLLFYFHHPAVVSFAAPLVRTLGGNEATHYPELMYALPHMFRSIDRWLMAVVGSVAIGGAVAAFAKAYGFLLPRRTFSGKVLVALNLVLLGAVSLELAMLVERLFDLVPDDYKLSSTMIRLGLSGIELLVAIIVQCALAYTTAWVVLRGDAPWSALRDSAISAARTPLVTFLLVAVPAAMVFPFHFALYEMDLSERDLPPEIMAILLAARLVLELVLTFLREGSLTRVFVWRQLEEQR